jgi:hypothetical protein
MSINSQTVAVYVAALLALSATSANGGALMGTCKTISPGVVQNGETIHVIRTRPDDKAPSMWTLPNNITVDVLDRYVNKGKIWLWIETNDNPEIPNAMGWARQDTLKCDLWK